ncbi:GBS Bsp-like repeat-containing protein [Paenibacillus sonchi]|uniref:GBS Bsp-like repeat-containing protein n=1 Tax=Paenibacillus sonchi TaxID=373687 RepID=A0A974SD70_9BACL|nr:GBS Bsp-like repeat-containing protein [Paenibacillus sonchi]
MLGFKQDLVFNRFNFPQFAVDGRIRKKSIIKRGNNDPITRFSCIRINQFRTIILSSLLIYLFSILFSPAVWAEETKTSSYIIVNMAGTSQKQKNFVYNRGRLETEILPDNSMIQYTYDPNGNLLKRTKGYSVEPYVISTSAVSYDIYLKNVPDGVREVRFPTWTELNGQDDIDWIVGEKVAPGLWKCTVVLSKHGGITGTYITHIYADGVGAGGLTAQIQNTLKVTSPQAASLADGSYEVRVEGVARTVSEVRFPTWTENNGQDDLENPWIMGKRSMIPHGRFGYRLLSTILKPGIISLIFITLTSMGRWLELVVRPLRLRGHRGLQRNGYFRCVLRCFYLWGRSEGPKSPISDMDGL